MLEIIKVAYTGLLAALKRRGFKAITEGCDVLINLLLKLKTKVKIDGAK